MESAPHRTLRPKFHRNPSLLGRRIFGCGISGCVRQSCWRPATVKTLKGTKRSKSFRILEYFNNAESKIKPRTSCLYASVIINQSTQCLKASLFEAFRFILFKTCRYSFVVCIKNPPKIICYQVWNCFDHANFCSDHEKTSNISLHDQGFWRSLAKIRSSKPLWARISDA